MEVSFRNRELRELYANPKARAPFPASLVDRFRRIIWLIQSSTDERDFRAFGKGLGFEQLKRERAHQHSFRLNDQFRLIVEICGESPKKTVEVIEVVDYH